MNKRGQTVNSPWTTENNGEQMCSPFCENVNWFALLFCKNVNWFGLLFEKTWAAQFTSLEKTITKLFLMLENENIFVLDFRKTRPYLFLILGSRNPQRDPENRKSCGPAPPFLFFSSNIVRRILFWSCFVRVFSNIVRKIFECLEKKKCVSKIFYNVSNFLLHRTQFLSHRELQIES